LVGQLKVKVTVAARCPRAGKGKKGWVQQECSRKFRAKNVWEGGAEGTAILRMQIQEKGIKKDSRYYSRFNEKSVVVRSTTERHIDLNLTYWRIREKLQLNVSTIRGRS